MDVGDLVVALAEGEGAATVAVLLIADPKVDRPGD